MRLASRFDPVLPDDVFKPEGSFRIIYKNVVLSLACFGGGTIYQCGKLK